MEGLRPIFGLLRSICRPATTRGHTLLTPLRGVRTGPTTSPQRSGWTRGPAIPACTRAGTRAAVRVAARAEGRARAARANEPRLIRVTPSRRPNLRLFSCARGESGLMPTALGRHASPLGEGSRRDLQSAHRPH